MSILLYFVDLLVTALVTLDTLGFIVNSRKSKEGDAKDFYRICFTWASFMVINMLCCSSCTGTLGFLWNFVLVSMKIFVGIPKTGGAEKMNNTLVEQNMAVQYAKSLYEMVMQKLVPKEKSE